MSIENRIKTYILENFLFSDNGYGLAKDASFLEEGIVDSTGVLELVMFVEETFDIIVEDEEIVPENFDSVNQLATYIRHKGS
jgi:acyl carrier protein